MTPEEKRTPAFWRVVSSRGGRTIYLTSRMDPWSYKQHEAIGYDTEHEAKAAVACLGMHVRIRPVMHRVIKKPKGHGIGWAVKQLKAGKRVRQKAWQTQSFIVLTDDGRVRWGKDGIPFYPSCELLSSDWELAE